MLTHPGQAALEHIKASRFKAEGVSPLSTDESSQPAVVKKVRFE